MQSQAIIQDSLKKSYLQEAISALLPQPLIEIVTEYVDDKKCSEYIRHLSPVEHELIMMRLMFLDYKTSKKTLELDAKRILYGLIVLEKSPPIFSKFAKECWDLYEEKHHKDWYKHSPTKNTQYLLDLLSTEQTEQNSELTSTAIELYLKNKKSAHSKLYSILIEKISAIYDENNISNLEFKQKRHNGFVSRIVKKDRPFFYEGLKKIVEFTTELLPANCNFPIVDYLVGLLERMQQNTFSIFNTEDCAVLREVRGKVDKIIKILIQSIDRSNISYHEDRSSYVSIDQICDGRLFVITALRHLDLFSEFVDLILLKYEAKPKEKESYHLPCRSKK